MFGLILEWAVLLDSSARLDQAASGQRMDSQANPMELDKQQRVAVAAFLSILLAAVEVLIDWITWVELNVSILYGLPLVLAALGRSRRLLWTLMLILVTMTFAVYVAQIPAGLFTIQEPLFINRMLAALALVITAGILHVRLRAIEKLAAQDEALQGNQSAAGAGQFRNSSVARPKSFIRMKNLLAASRGRRSERAKDAVHGVGLP